MEQYSNNNKNEFLWTLLANPANDAHLHAYNLQRLVNDFPQSGILQALLAHASDNKNLRQASAYFNPRALYKLINAPSSFIGVADEKIVIQPALATNGSYRHYEPTAPAESVEDKAVENYFNESVTPVEPPHETTPFPLAHEPVIGHDAGLHIDHNAIGDQHTGPFTEAAESFLTAGHSANDISEAPGIHAAEALTPPPLPNLAEEITHEFQQPLEQIMHPSAEQAPLEGLTPPPLPNVAEEITHEFQQPLEHIINPAPEAAPIDGLTPPPLPHLAEEITHEFQQPGEHIIHQAPEPAPFEGLTPPPLQHLAEEITPEFQQPGGHVEHQPSEPPPFTEAMTPPPLPNVAEEVRHEFQQSDEPVTYQPGEPTSFAEAIAGGSFYDDAEEITSHLHHAAEPVISEQQIHHGVEPAVLPETAEAESTHLQTEETAANFHPVAEPVISESPVHHSPGFEPQDEAHEAGLPHHPAEEITAVTDHQAELPSLEPPVYQHDEPAVFEPTVSHHGEPVVFEQPTHHPAEPPVQQHDEPAAFEPPVIHHGEQVVFEEPIHHPEEPVAFEPPVIHAEEPPVFEQSVHHPEEPVAFEPPVIHAEEPPVHQPEEIAPVMQTPAEGAYHQDEHISEEFHQHVAPEPVMNQTAEARPQYEATPETSFGRNPFAEGKKEEPPAKMPDADISWQLQATPEKPVTEDIDETYDEIVGIENINFEQAPNKPGSGNNFFSFDKEFGEHADEEKDRHGSAGGAARDAAGDADHQDVSKYHDEKMPYTFMWWLDKTRKEHAQIYQPYVKPPAASTVKKPKKPTDELQQQYFENIFHITSVEELDKSTPPPPQQAPYNTKRKDQVIIERFIKEEPQIRPQSSDKLDNENKAKKSSEDRDEMVTETLASIYSDQMLYHKAISSYKKLMLKFPEKTRYFAEKIEQLEKKTN